VKNDKEVYMQLRNFQQQVDEQVEVYYEPFLITNCLQVKAIDVFFTTISKACLQPYLKLTTTNMIRDTYIKHKEIAMICEKNGPIITNYNTLIIQPKSKLVARPIVHYIMVT
jgi:hypothetical protein